MPDPPSVRAAGQEDEADVPGAGDARAALGTLALAVYSPDHRRLGKIKERGRLR
jgi:hypothetical protein